MREKGDDMGFEIERKWLPDKTDAETLKGGAAASSIIQGYLCTEPVIRVRKDGEKYYMTYKGSGLLKREEHDLPLTAGAFDALIKKCEGRIIEKERYRYPFPGDPSLTVELDIFGGDLEGLMMLEVEFSDDEAAEKFRAPGAFGKEVTEDPRYTNAALSTGSFSVKE